MEVLVNDLAFALSAAIASTTATTLSVGSGSGIGTLPPSGQFRARIDNEVVIVTGVSGSTWTVTRGAEGTTPATHSSGAAVNVVVTAGALEQITQDRVQAGAFASRPSTAPASRLYLTGDAPHLYRGNGTTWDAFGPIFPIVEPPTTGWTNVNFSNAGAVVDYSRGFPVLSCPSGPASGSGSDNIALIYRAAPSPTYSLEAMILPSWPANSNSRQVGICFYDSATGKILTFGYDGGQAYLRIGAYNYSNPTTNSGNILTATAIDGEQCKFLRLGNDGTNLAGWVSSDGFSWQGVFTQAAGASISPNSLGFFIDPVAASNGVAGSLVHWNVH